MDVFWLDVASLMLRFFHVVSGVAWIGASFYFIWLDNHLETPPQWKKDKGIKGDLWAIHGGGFYEVAKYEVAPETLPPTLHWFKWEAYSTWISGVLLLSLLYYVGAEAYLIDTQKSTMMPLQAISFSVASIVLGWFVYDGLCRSPLVKNGSLFTVCMVGLIALWSFVLDRYLSDRAAYIHVGAVIGTCMAFNVWRVIVPSQRYLVDTVTAGGVPDNAFGLRAKLRSTHNNYATLPLLFIMISNHYPMTFTHAHGWLVLVALFVIGMWIRHYFNLRHQGMNKPVVLITGLAAFFLLMIMLMPRIPAPAPAASTTVQVISDEQGMELIAKHCTTCHAKQPSDDVFTVAPNGVYFETLEQVETGRDWILARAVYSRSMPFANKTAMTEEERADLGAWLRTK